MRGVGASGASRALVLVDDIPLNDPFGGWVYWDRVVRESISDVEVVRELGKSSGEHLYRLARADDDRPVEPERETKSISIEDTFEHDINDTGVLGRIAERHAAKEEPAIRAGGGPQARFGGASCEESTRA